MKKKISRKHQVWYIGTFLICNFFAFLFIGQMERNQIQKSIRAHAEQSQSKVQSVMNDYRHSFQLFANMLAREIEVEPDPNQIWAYLKRMDGQLLKTEGATFDGLYMYYQNAYLYSWDTPYEEYAKTGYDATTRPWYINAVEGKGEIVFTPPYMSYANHYILSTISQLQDDNQTVFAYDIKMENIQKLVASSQSYSNESFMIYDHNGTVIGSSDERYLGGNLKNSPSTTKKRLEETQRKAEKQAALQEEDQRKLQDEIQYAQAFYDFQKDFHSEYKALVKTMDQAQLVTYQNKAYIGYVHSGKEFDFLILIPLTSMLSATMQTWLVPLLILEIILIYILSQISRELKNRELKSAYVELGQTQKRLEIALQAAQKAAAIDELTGMMNLKSFRSTLKQHLQEMQPNEAGILIMIDGDHFKMVNDQYGHMIGDEVIKLSAQMIVGRIRMDDYASRLHGDEFSIFVTNCDDYSVAERIMQDINDALAKQAQKQNLPAITLSSGAIIAHANDHYVELVKAADDALYKAKETHNGAFVAAN